MTAAGPELRKDALSGRWVIFAPERKNRPDDFHRFTGVARITSPTACPFCEGHEQATPPELYALRRPGTKPDGPGWQVRVVPNKFPAVRPGPHRRETRAGLFASQSGAGSHEVIVDAPEHGREWADLSIDRVRKILGVYRKRVALAEKTPGIRFVQMFKNKGREAGASLTHSHTQIIALPVVPVDIRREAARAARERRRSGWTAAGAPH